MQRRSFLLSAGFAALTAGLAGCTGAGPGGSTATETSTSSQTLSPTVTESTPPSGDWQRTQIDGGTVGLRVTNRECGQGADTATVTFGDDRVRISGTISGSDTCATAMVADADLADGTLTLTIESVQEATTGTPACGQCIVDIDYRAQFIPDADLPQSVTVVHDGADGTVTVTETNQ